MMEDKDLNFKQGSQCFQVRVGAVILRDGQVLMVKHHLAPYFYTAGGRVQYAESTEEAIVRELYEETGHEFTVERLLFIHENFFFEATLELEVHEICFFYLMGNLPAYKLVSSSITPFGGIEELHWLALEDLPKHCIIPDFFKSELKNLPLSPKHIVSSKISDK